MSRTAAPRTAASRLVALAALLVSLTGSLVASSAAPALAATPGMAAVAEAARHSGQPYAYGASGPTHFDCSGFTLYVFSRFGKHLPHNSGAQYAAVQHIARSSEQVGDLIFLRGSAGSLGHVGIYAGNGRMWDAPRSGLRVSLRTIYSSNYLVGRVR